MTAKHEALVKQKLGAHSDHPCRARVQTPTNTRQKETLEKGPEPGRTMGLIPRCPGGAGSPQAEVSLQTGRGPTAADFSKSKKWFQLTLVFALCLALASGFWTLIHITLTSSWDRDLYYPRGTDEETAAERGDLACLRPHSQGEAESGFEAPRPGSQGQVLGHKGPLHQAPLLLKGGT